MLSACDPANVPLQFTSVSVSPEPIVGQIVTLDVQIMSIQDESQVTFTLKTLEQDGNKLQLVFGEPEWTGLLTANQPQSFQFSICVWQAGSWPIRIRAVLRLPDGNDWHALETIHLESSSDSGQLIRGQDMMMIVGSVKSTSQPTSVSPERSGQSE